MTTKNQQEHDAEIIDQFTKQAIPFAKLPEHLDAIQMLIEISKVNKDDLFLMLLVVRVWLPVNLLKLPVM